VTCTPRTASPHILSDGGGAFSRCCLIGTTVVAYLLAFSRWGSHVNVLSKHVYLTDVLMLFTVVAWWRAGGRLPMLWKAPAAVRLVLAIPLVAAVRFALAADVSVDALRDVAPYIYAAVAVFALVPHPAGSSRRSYWVLRGALIVHLVFVTFALAFPSLVSRLPEVAPAGPESRMLSIRPDFACACISVLAVTAALRISRSRGIGARRKRVVACELALLVWSVGTTLKLGARSGLIALFVACLFIAAEFFPRFLALRPRTRAVLAIGTLLVLAFAVPRLHAFERLGQTVQAFGIAVDPNNPPPDAAGTAHARLDAWRKTLRYTNETTARRVAGVGFGPNFLHSSGAETLLSGNDETGAQLYTGVRAPHNYLLNTYARMGLIGLTVVVAALGFVLLSAFRVIRRSRSEFDVMVSALFVCLLVVAMFGVILESPFGAIPAFWAAGWIATRSAGLRMQGAGAGSSA
jgi:hypothetical protein